MIWIAIGTGQGGFDENAVAVANILEIATPVIGGKQYYSLSVLTRTADGDEGGKHQLITATVADGKLYICKAQAGDKRWFKGARKYVENAANSFSVAWKFSMQKKKQKTIYNYVMFACSSDTGR